jgi:hypothetical protein
LVVFFILSNSFLEITIASDFIPFSVLSLSSFSSFYDSTTACPELIRVFFFLVLPNKASSTYDYFETLDFFVVFDLLET